MSDVRAALFRFAQIEVPWLLGPPDGRYVLRPDNAPGADVSHVLVLASVGAARRGRRRRDRPRETSAEPEPTAVMIGRATIIDGGATLADDESARAWLRHVGEAELEAALVALNRMLSAFRRVAADPYVTPVARAGLLVARLGYGTGEQVADGRWEQAIGLPTGSAGPRGRRRENASQARLAAALGARQRLLVCEELVLRARLDLDHGRPREAALQLLVALDAALSELGSEPAELGLGERVQHLRGRREAVAAAAQAALGADPADREQRTVRETVEQLQATLRARAAALP